MPIAVRSFPFDKIKIDRSFIRDISTKPGSTAIVHAIAELARSLGMTTTAEGVETEEHLELLRAEGCTEIQGFLISPPKPASIVGSLLAKYNGTSGLRQVLKLAETPYAPPPAVRLQASQQPLASSRTRKI